jgi:hypothetical protein
MAAQPVQRSQRVGGEIDPTENVMALVAAMAKSQADLREADNKYYYVVMDGLKATASLRAEHAKEMRVSEAERLSKVREVDVQAGNQQAASLATAVQALAATTDRNAETLRTAVANSASALAKQVSDAAAATATQTLAANTAMEKRISDLEKSQNLGAGRQSVADPQMDKFMERLEKISGTQLTGAGKSEGISMAWAAILGLLTMVSLMVGIGAVVYEATRVSAPSPVVYMPAPVPVTPAIPAQAR